MVSLLRAIFRLLAIDGDITIDGAGEIFCYAFRNGVTDPPE
jgi:hypothetical protein